jgi:hypothetical protein
MRHNKLWNVSTLSTVEAAMHFVLKCSIKHYQLMIWHVISFVQMEVAIHMVAYVHVHDLQKAGFLSLLNRRQRQGCCLEFGGTLSGYAVA